VRDRRERQERLVEALRERDHPVTGGELATLLGVTRQVVVHEIALLRAQGVPIVSTPRGYFLEERDDRQERYILAVNHPPELTSTELKILVDYGVRVIDVLVEHPLYGELRGSLHLASRRDVDLFLQQLHETKASLLSSLTDGHHLHTVECADPARLNEAIAELRKHGIQVFD
jgi:transcriptional regulator of NAD metabolism